MPPSVQYRSLCISEVNRNVTDNALREEIYKKFEKFGDFFNIKISFFNNQRVAYINFTYDEDARKAHQEFHNMHLFGKSVKVEPVPIKTNPRNRRDGSRSPSPLYKKKIGESSPPYSSLTHEIRSTNQKFSDEYYDAPPFYNEPPPKSRYIDEYYDDEYHRYPPHGPPLSFKHKPIDIYPLDATRSLFIGNIPDDIEESEVFKIFKPFGPITDVDVKRAAKGKTTAYAFVKYFTLDYALRAKDEMQGQLIGKLSCKIGFGKPSPTKKLWVGGLAPWTTYSLLEREFERFGPITKIDYYKGDSFAFILYDNLDSSELAYHEMKGIDIISGPPGSGGPPARIMTDFADQKPVFYDKTSVYEFLDSLQHRHAATPPPQQPYVHGRRPLPFDPAPRRPLPPPSHMGPGGVDMDDMGPPPPSRHHHRYSTSFDHHHQHPLDMGPSSYRRGPAVTPQYHHTTSSASTMHNNVGRTTLHNNSGNNRLGPDREEGEMREDEDSNTGPSRYRKTARTDAYHSQETAFTKSNTSQIKSLVDRNGDDPSSLSFELRNRNSSGANAGDNQSVHSSSHGKHGRTTSSRNRSIKRKRSVSSTRSQAGAKSSSSGQISRSHSKSMSPSSARLSHKTSRISNGKRTHARSSSHSSSSSSQSGSFSSDQVATASRSDSRKDLINVTTLEALVTHLEPAYWHGHFTIKNSLFPIVLYPLKRGTSLFAKSVIMPLLQGINELKIVQRFRLDSNKIDDMAKLIHKVDDDLDELDVSSNAASGGNLQYTINLALDADLEIGTKNIINNNSTNETDQQTQNNHKRHLKDLINYLVSKNAAGVALLKTPTNEEHIVYAFPPCDFSKQFFAKSYPKLILPNESASGSNNAVIHHYLLIVILKGASKKH